MLPAFARRLPFVSKALFGDRVKFGQVPFPNDPDWAEWNSDSVYAHFYNDTQRSGVGKIVNDAGYRIHRETRLTGKTVLEIGPGTLEHLSFANGIPEKYLVIDVNQDFLDIATAKLTKSGIPTEAIITSRDTITLPLPTASVDTIISFYSLEHLHPLGLHLDEMERVLKPGGELVGAIPAEGGLAWGLGRYLTSRRWLRRNTTIDPGKIICWEHVNFADQIISALKDRFELDFLAHWPLRLPSPDVNLVTSFVARRT